MIRLYGIATRFCFPAAAIGTPAVTVRKIPPPAIWTREWELLDRFTAAGKPILGICRGMQSINIFFGGTLCQDIPGHGQINGEDRIHPVFSAPGIFAALWGNNERDCIVNSAHHQVIDRPGDGLRVEQWAADGVAEALRHTRFPIWGVQWHPERLPGPIGRRLFAAFLEQIP